MTKKIPEPLQIGIAARKRFGFSHAQVQMARALGLNPRKLGSLANHRQEPWTILLPDFIEHLYFKSFAKKVPDRVLWIEDRCREIEEKKAQGIRPRRRVSKTEPTRIGHICQGAVLPAVLKRFPKRRTTRIIRVVYTPRQAQRCVQVQATMTRRLLLLRRTT